MKKFIFNVIVLSFVLFLFISCSDDNNTAYPEPDIPKTPDSLSVTTLSSSSVRLDWTDNSDNEDGFIIEYSLTDSFEIFTGIVAEQNDTTAVIDGLEASKEYFFRLYAFNEEGGSDYSVHKSATTDQLPQNEPAAPQNFNVTVISSSEISANWTDFSDNEENFIIEWSTADFVKDTYSVVLDANSTSADITGLSENTVYYFRLSASNSYGSSEWTATESAETYEEVSGSFAIQFNNSSYTNSVNVTLYMSLTGISQMKFSNDGTSWSPIESYKTKKSWTLSTNDGIKRARAKFYDPAGTEYEFSDDILLDTTAPEIVSFTINDNADDTYSSTVTLNCDVIGASQMRFAQLGGLWTPWYDFDLTHTYSVPAVENEYQYVYAEFRDEHGNVTEQVNDRIKYDAYRTIRIIATTVKMDFAGDGGGTGEVYWSFTGSNNSTGQNFTISEREIYYGEYESIDDQGIYNFPVPYSEYVETTLPRGQFGNYVSLNIIFKEYDSDSNDEYTPVRTENIFESNNWNIGEYTEITVGDITDPLRGTMRFFVSSLD